MPPSRSRPSGRDPWQHEHPRPTGGKVIKGRQRRCDIAPTALMKPSRIVRFMKFCINHFKLSSLLRSQQSGTISGYQHHFTLKLRWFEEGSKWHSPEYGQRDGTALGPIVWQ